MAADEHHIRVSFGDSRRHCADTHFGDQLHADARVAIAVFEIVDELREVLDGINVVMRRWRNQADTGRGMARLRDPRIHLASGKLTSLTWFGALRHLDLQLARMDQIFTGDAESTRGDLL